MNELEKMIYAKSWTDKMANGINPLTDEAVKDDDIINNVRISRCLFYVSDILRQAIDNGGINPAFSSQPKVTSSDELYPFAISTEELKKFEYSDTPINITALTKRINTLVDTERIKKLSNNKILNWLLQIDFLYEETTPEGRKKRRPTEMGLSVGITEELRSGMYGEYKAVVYNRTAQEFIIDNLHAVCDVYTEE